MTTLFSILGIVGCLLLSAFFSGSEIALNSANRLRMSNLAEEGSKTARLVEKINNHFTSALSTILISNTLVNMAASTIATTLAMGWMIAITGEQNDGLASLLSTIVMTIIVLMFGEVVPKIIAKEHADFISRFVAYPIRILSFLLFPLVWIVTTLVSLLSKIWGKDYDEGDPTVTEEELSSIIETVEEEGVIDEEKGELLQSTIDFQDTTVGEILTPRIDLVTIDIEDDFASIEAICDGSPFSRLPVYEDSIDEIIGILSLNHFYKAKLDSDSFDIRPLLMEASFIHKTMRLPQALDLMKRKHTHMAIVVDEFGGTMGVVTLEDILEELVGDIWDESDTIEEEIKPIAENTYEVLGDMNIEDFFDELEFEDLDFESEYTTVGGWCVEMLDAEPAVGRGFDYKNLSMTVLEMDDMRVTKVRAFLEPLPEENN